MGKLFITEIPIMWTSDNVWIWFLFLPLSGPSSPSPVPPPAPLLFTSSRRQIKWYIIHLQSPISPHHLLSASFIILIEPGVIENALKTERKRLLFINLSKMRIEISINNMVCFLIVWSYSQYKNKKVRNGQPLISSSSPFLHFELLIWKIVLHCINHCISG